MPKFDVINVAIYLHHSLLSKQKNAQLRVENLAQTTFSLSPVRILRYPTTPCCPLFWFAACSTHKIFPGTNTLQWVENNPTNIRIFPANICIFCIVVLR